MCAATPSPVAGRGSLRQSLLARPLRLAKEARATTRHTDRAARRSPRGVSGRSSESASPRRLEMLDPRRRESPAALPLHRRHSTQWQRITSTERPAHLYSRRPETAAGRAWFRHARDRISRDAALVRAHDAQLLTISADTAWWTRVGDGERGVGAVVVLEATQSQAILRARRDEGRRRRSGGSASVTEWMTRHPDTIEPDDTTEHAPR